MKTTLLVIEQLEIQESFDLSCITSQLGKLVTPSLSIYLLTQWSLGFVIVPESCVALAMKGISMPSSLRSSIRCPVKNNPRETSLGCREGGGWGRKKVCLIPCKLSLILLFIPQLQKLSCHNLTKNSSAHCQVLGFRVC